MLAASLVLASRGEAQQLESVRFEGVHSFAEDSLRAAIVNRATGCKDPLFMPACVFGFALDRHDLVAEELSADAVRLRLYYYERGFRAASAVPHVDTLANGAARLTFRVQEGTPVRVGRIDITGVPPGLSAPMAELPLDTGDPLDLLRYEAARDSLRVRLRNAGFARAEVLAGFSIPSDAPGSAFVEYELIPGPVARFGSVDVDGAARVDPALIRRMLSFQPGDVYSEEALQRSRRNLFALELFRHADVREQLAGAPDSIVPVVVQVNEGNQHRIRAGAGLNSLDCLNAEGRWTDRNLFGGGRRLEIRARVSNVLAEQVGGFPCAQAGSGIYDDVTGSIAADFAQPWLFGPGRSLGSGLFAERQSVPDLFVRTSRGTYLSLTRAPRQRSSLSLTYRPALTELRAADDVFCASFVLCDANDIRLLRDPHWLAPLTLSFIRDRANALFAPTGGYILRLEAEYAGGASGSAFAYQRLQGDVSWYAQPSSGLVVAGRLHPGVAWAPRAEGVGLHPQKRFFAGGPNSIRGYAQNRLGPKTLSVSAGALLADSSGGRAVCSVAQVNDGSCDAAGIPDERFAVRPTGGNVLLEGSMELRFPLLLDRLQGAAFVDAGQVWSDVDAIDLSAVVFTPGVGVRFFSPAGPIRVDLGYNASGAEQLPVITTELDASGRTTGRLRTLDRPLSWNLDRSFVDRLQLHFSIGQAF